MSRKRKITKTTKSIFNRFFGFETGVDLTDEVAVLHRRNVVIKNIILLSNLFYTAILIIIAVLNKIQETSQPVDWLFPALFFPFTFFLNTVIKKIIFSDRHDKTKQEVGMYLLAIYMFVISILFYARFIEHNQLETATYIMIYYAIVVISLYQSRKLILWSSFGMLSAITIIHFTWTYRLSDAYKGLSVDAFLAEFIKSQAFIDILLRTIVFLMFVVVVYAIVSIGSYMQEERRNELIKRRAVQEDFTTIVSDLFKVVLSSKSSFLDIQHVKLVSMMSLKLAELYSLDTETLHKIKVFSDIHLRYNEIEALVNPEVDIEPDFDLLKEKTMLGTLIAKRLQLAQKAEEIARAHIEGAASDQFIMEMQQIQPEISSQIILLCDLYITMRSPKSYKRAYPNAAVIELFTKSFTSYFEFQLLDRFLRFSKDFEIMYNEF